MSNKSFTLIELLVVIAIIGLLASVVLVSTQGLQTKAKLTKTLEFSQTLNNALGAYAVGSWSFDEGSGTSALDASGYGNDGTISGATYNADTPHAAIGRGTGKWALNFDGGDDYVQIANFNTNNMVSASYWIYPVDLSGSQSVFSHSNLYQMVGVGGNANLATLFSDDTPKACSSPLTASTWSFVYIDFTNKQIYKNGVNCTTVYVIGWTHDTYTGLVIGYSVWYSAPNGLIDEVRIYETALTLGQIQQLYAAGLESHQDLVLK